MTRVSSIIINNYFKFILMTPTINVPIERHRCLSGVKNKSHLYAVYKRFSLDLKIHIDYKWIVVKRYSMQIEKRES